MKGALILGVNQMGGEHMGLLERRRDIRIAKAEKIDKNAALINIIVTSYYDLGEKTLSKLPKLEFILAASSGYNYVDLEFAGKRNIVVSNCPDYAANSVAEHALGLILSCLRSISLSDREVRVGEFTPFPYKGTELSNKTVGVVGYGRIGSRLAAMVRALGAKVIWVDSKSDAGKRRKLFSDSDIVTIHVPLKKDTEGMISEKEFALMKDGAVFINTARGAIVDEAALIEALKSGKVRRAGLDVFAKEPLSKKSALLKMSNVVITPHIAGFTYESKKRLSAEAYSALLSYLNGKPINVVNLKSK